MLKKIGSMFLAAIMIFCLSSVSVWAGDRSNSQDAWSNVGANPPSDPQEVMVIVPFGLEAPTNFVNLNDGSLTFAGEADYSTLYTNKGFTGKSTVTYSITNYLDRDLTVKVRKTDNWFTVETLKVNKNSTSTGTITGLDSSGKYYLSFSAPSDFSGSVS